MVENPEAETYQITVAPDAARQRLDRLLSGQLETLSRMRIKALIEAGQVQIRNPDDDNGRTVTEAS
ncbi:MAG: hypothetical protein HN732_18115, partial [Rhodospirillaceae bacterium]|nr:hypothetical protein [Rhodospirillaceae bacterium]